MHISRKIPDFEDVWNQILSIVKNKKSIRTLALGVENIIFDVSLDKITLASERTDIKRYVTKEDVKKDWEILAEKGTLRIGEEKTWHGSIVAALLAELPFIGYSLKPRTLYFRKNI